MVLKVYGNSISFPGLGNKSPLISQKALRKWQRGSTQSQKKMAHGIKP